MAKFRVELDVAFNTEEDAIAFFNQVEQWKDKVAPATTSTGPQAIAIITNARYHECFHDDVPPKPCGNYINIDFKSSKTEHKTVKGDTMVISADNTKAVTKQKHTDEIGSIKP